MKKLILHTALCPYFRLQPTVSRQSMYSIFIGDGMGVNQVNGTEMYQAELQNGRIGVEPFICSPNFR